ncbi:hypothetical protein FBU59_005452 [Linderina macrospora]|uniref:Uncharacterized protein n=1 Tax=Linderina macrospora TaxID=4868 RepID=A0ACC1J2R6_9FUNG|nr:hypothetical protein FBU59_005452 [Linderina macrospora]
MDRDSFDSIRPGIRGWAPYMQSPLSPSTVLPRSPSTPQSAFTPRTAFSPASQSNFGYKVSTPATPMSATSSLTVLDAKNIARDFGQARLDLTAEDKWRRLGARVLPLFNGDRLQGTVEENNEIVR